MNVGAFTELLAAALPGEHLSEHDVARGCGGPGTQLLGDRDAAAALNIADDGRGAWIVALAVHPAQQRGGLARDLVSACADAARAAGAPELHLGNAAPRYLWPGVDFAWTPALALFESTGFQPYGATCNMALPTAFRADSPTGVTVERETGAGATDLARRAFPHWVDEVSRSTAAGTAFAARAGETTIGFACHSANRDGWIGPMATDPDHGRHGTGHALLSALCADLAGRGIPVAEIAWVGPIGFYAKAGAHVSRVFRNARRPLAGRPTDRA